jgi:hypothetical protein
MRKPVFPMHYRPPSQRQSRPLSVIFVLFNEAKESPPLSVEFVLFYEAKNRVGHYQVVFVLFYEAKESAPLSVEFVSFYEAKDRVGHYLSNLFYFIKFTAELYCTLGPSL